VLLVSRRRGAGRPRKRFTKERCNVCLDFFRPELLLRGRCGRCRNDWLIRNG
jgi:hypothetical protein